MLAADNEEEVLSYLWLSWTFDLLLVNLCTSNHLAFADYDPHVNLCPWGNNRREGKRLSLGFLH